MQSVKVQADGREFFAEAGKILADVLLQNGIDHPRPCGGQGSCGKCLVSVNGKPELACRYILREDATVTVPQEGEILSVSGAAVEAGEGGTDLILDLGTTTLAMARIDAGEKKIRRLITAKNPQRRIGADVISRIEYAARHGVGEMASLIREEICHMIEVLGSAPTLHVAGNTTMLHILAGENPRSLGAAPYTPVFLEERLLDAAALGITGVNQVHLLPGIAAFVGADSVAGIAHVGLPSADKYRLLVDLGTNAEILLFSRDRILATAAAAGPCFEGGNISCGMSATAGAICSFGEGGYKTVENAAPCGICGTGLVDVIAYLLRRGIIDESGYMEEEEFPLHSSVAVSREDVRQYQLAKSAICSGILALMHRASVDFTEIEGLYIAGGFAAQIDVDNAVYTGLLPAQLRDVCISVGNSSLMGAAKSVFEGTSLSPIARRAEYADLAGDSLFAELFMQNMGFDI